MKDIIMALTGFEYYNDQIKKFEKSKLFLQCFREFVDLVKCHTIDRPVTSKQIEEHFGRSGAEIRKLVRHARLKGIRIGSSGDGYFYARSRDEIEDTINHLIERRNALNMIINRLEAPTNAENPQTSLF